MEHSTLKNAESVSYDVVSWARISLAPRRAAIAAHPAAEVVSFDSVSVQMAQSIHAAHLVLAKAPLRLGYGTSGCADAALVALSLGLYLGGLTVVAIANRLVQHHVDVPLVFLELFQPIVHLSRMSTRFLIWARDVLPSGVWDSLIAIQN